MSGSGWSTAKVFILRQAGFPIDLVGPLGSAEIDAPLADVWPAAVALDDAATRLRRALSAVDHSKASQVASVVGMSQPVPLALQDAVAAGSEADVRHALADYQHAISTLNERWSAYSDAHERCLNRERSYVVDLFRKDMRLRDVLLLSNDAHFARFDSWLTNFVPDSWGQKPRRMADMLTMYLQRVTTKNETHSHFGPITIGHFDRATPWLSWQSGTEKRYAFFSHWAAEELGRQFAANPELWPRVRPRRRPWAMQHGSRAHLFAFTTQTGMPADWNFVELPGRDLAPQELWLFDHADGIHTVAQLRQQWGSAGMPNDGSFDRALASLLADELIFAHFEIAVGDPQPLPSLRARIVDAEPDTTRELVVLDQLDELVARFASTEHPERVHILGKLKDTFEQATGKAANRLSGRHYADRSPLYEECHAALDQLIAGRHLHDLVTNDLAVVYDLLLLGPRYRITHEQQVLASWLATSFGTGREVPLLHFYQRYFADRAELAAQCRVIDDHLSALHRRLVRELLALQKPGEREIEVPRDVLKRMIAQHPRTPRALCNPDVMLASSSINALNSGDFLAVIGDCHAMRELLTHHCWAPIVAEHSREGIDDIIERYHTLVDHDELLCDVARVHNDKTDAQVLYPGADVEFLGLSPKDRAMVMQPADLHVVASEGQIQLRTKHSGKRIRLLAPPAGSSIASDPLAVFSFPRYFGGLTIPSAGHGHVPRIRCGKVVLQRELWRISPDALTGTGPGIMRRVSDATVFYAVSEIRQQHQIPRFAFAKIAEEPKPIFVDFQSPLLIRQMFRLARNSNDDIVLTEMLPGPDQLWLEVAGHKYTSELRCALFSS